MYPDDAPYDDQRHRRKEHQTVVGITAAVGDVPAFGNDLVAEQRSRTEQFAEEGHDHQNHTVAQTVADTVEECGPGLVAQSECLHTTHHDTVGDNQTDIDGKLFGHFIDVCLQYLVHENHQRGDHNQLNDNTDTRRHALAQARHHHTRKTGHDGHREGHYDRRLHLHGYRQGRADTQDLHDDGVVRRERTGQVFQILSREDRLLFITHGSRLRFAG